MIVPILFLAAALAFLLSLAEVAVPRVNLTTLGWFFIAVALAIEAWHI